jgi:RNA polymerase sigma-70 factor (ECF subfamily)
MPRAPLPRRGQPFFFDHFHIRSSIIGDRRGCGEPVSDDLEAWVPRVYRFALRLCHDPHVADDLTQDTFLRAWRRRGDLRDDRAMRVWLFRITANLWNDQIRRARSPVARAGSLDDAKPSDDPLPPRLAARREEVDRALKALAHLPPRQREVLHLSACEGLSTAEVALILGISIASAKANLSLARKAMREQLHDVASDSAAAE